MLIAWIKYVVTICEYIYKLGKVLQGCYKNPPDGYVIVNPKGYVTVPLLRSGR